MSRVVATSLCVITITVIFVDIAFAIRSHGDSCHKRKDCDSGAGLTCLKNKCQCPRPESTVYSEALQSCLVRVGRRCDEPRNTTIYHDDTNNADESTTNQSISAGTTCIENAECRKLRARHWCQCKDGYIVNSDGSECRSMSKYGEFCDEDIECDKSLGTVCIDGNCQCPFSEHQFFDQFTGVCTSFASGNCSIPKMSPCVSNAECTSAQVRMGYTTEKGVKKIHTKTVTQCLCKPGHSQTTNGFCFGAYGTSCSSKQPCNSEDYLACVDGKCICRNKLHEAHDEASGQCVNLVGTLCDPKGRGPRCVENSECVDGRCECKEGYTVTPNKTCLLDYKEACLPNTCNGYLGLACVKGRCECFDSYLLYDVSTKACVAVSSSSDD